jgi:hypothetical protein
MIDEPVHKMSAAAMRFFYRFATLGFIAVAHMSLYFGFNPQIAFPWACAPVETFVRESST